MNVYEFNNDTSLFLFFFFEGLIIRVNNIVCVLHK